MNRPIGQTLEEHVANMDTRLWKVEEELSRVIAQLKPSEKAELGESVAEQIMAPTGATFLFETFEAPLHAPVPVPDLQPAPAVAPIAEPQPTAAEMGRKLIAKMREVHQVSLNPPAYPPPMPPKVEPSPEAVRNHEPIAPVVKKKRPKPVADFMTEEEASGKPRRQQESKQPKPSMEEHIGTKWLMRVGGVLLILGLSWGAVELESHLSPVMRVMIGYLISIGLAVGAMIAGKRNDLVGGYGLVVAASVAYLVSFASHYIDRTTVTGFFQPYFAWVGMLASAAAVMAIGEKKRSEAMAGFGFMLAILGAYASSTASHGFAALSMLVISAAAGLFLVRNGWMRVTALALVGVWGGQIVIHLLTMNRPIAMTPGVLLLGGVLQYALFLGAYLRWGRVWLLRESMIERTPKEEAVPSIHGGLLPWSRSFDLLNTIGFMSFALLTVWYSSLRLDLFGTTLLAIAALSTVRVYLQPVRRSGTEAFHLVSAVAFSSLWALYVFDGISSAILLALQSVMLVVAGSSARSLRWLRPLSAIPTSLTMLAINPLAPALGLVGTIMPGILLMISALPFERWLAGKNWEHESLLLRNLSLATGLYRGTVAAILVLVALWSQFRGGVAQDLQHIMGITALVLGCLTVLSIRIGSIRQWMGSAVVFTLGSFLALQRLPSEFAFPLITLAIALLAAGWYSLSSLPFSKYEQAMAQVFAIFLSVFAIIYHLIWSMKMPLPVAMIFPAMMIAVGFFVSAFRTLEGSRATSIIVGAYLLASVTIWISGPMSILAMAILLAMVAVELLGSGRNNEGIRAALGKVALLQFLLALLATNFGKTGFLFLDTGFGEILNGWKSFIFLGASVVAIRLEMMMRRLSFSELVKSDLVTTHLLVAILVGICFTAAFVDASQSLWPSMILAIAAAISWLYMVSHHFENEEPKKECLVLLAAVVMMVVGSINYNVSTKNIDPLWMTAFLATFTFFAVRFNRKPMAILTLLGGLAIGSFVHLVWLTDLQNPPATWLILLHAALHCCSLLAISATARKHYQALPNVQGLMEYLPLALAIGAFLKVFTYLLDSWLITASFGLLAIVILAAGFLMQMRSWRWSAIGLFAFAILRVFAVDMQGADTTGRIVACTVLGTLLIASAYAYGFLSKRYLTEESKYER